MYVMDNTIENIVVIVFIADNLFEQTILHSIICVEILPRW